jgi:hypothetical protein
VGEARAFLHELRLSEGAVGIERATDALRAWWQERTPTDG